MKKHFNVDAYLRDAEARFSSANGEEWFEGESGFDSDFEGNFGLDLGFDGDYGVDAHKGHHPHHGKPHHGGHPMMHAPMMAAPDLKQPSPYQVIITNSTPQALTATLFGMFQFLQTPNYGSAAGLTVQNAVPNVTYLELLQQSATQPFETSLVRIQSANTSQITQTISITSKDANGQQAIIPLITQNYFSAFQFQSGILDIEFSIKIDGNTNLQFLVLPATTVFLTFFPSEKANLSRELNAQASLQTYAIPRVAIGMPMYVQPNYPHYTGHRHLPHQGRPHPHAPHHGGHRPHGGARHIGA